MIHRFDLTVKKELTKERGGRTPDYGFLHCAEEGAERSHQNTAPRKQDWELSLSLFAAAELTIGAGSDPCRETVQTAWERCHAPDFGYLHCAEGELSARTDSRAPRMKWG